MRKHKSSTHIKLKLSPKVCQSNLKPAGSDRTQKILSDLQLCRELTTLFNNSKKDFKQSFQVPQLQNQRCKIMFYFSILVVFAFFYVFLIGAIDIANIARLYEYIVILLHAKNVRPLQND